MKVWAIALLFVAAAFAADVDADVDAFGVDAEGRFGKIRSCEDFDRLRNSCGPYKRDEVEAEKRTKRFKLMNDVSCADVDFRPIGTQNYPFDGKFDGNGHQISNVRVDGKEVDSSRGPRPKGFFGSTNGALLKDVVIDNAFVRGRKEVGLLVGEAIDTKISNVDVSGDVECFESCGGIAGRMDDSKLEDSYVRVQITRPTPRFFSTEEVDALGPSDGPDAFGGAVGKLRDSKIEGTVAKGRISLESFRKRSTAGGLVGAVRAGIVKRSSAEFQISTPTFVGGLIGQVRQDKYRRERDVEANEGGREEEEEQKTDIEESYALGKLRATDIAGGLVADINEAKCSIDNCYAQSSVEVADSTNSRGSRGRRGLAVVSKFAAGLVGSFYGDGYRRTDRRSEVDAEGRVDLRIRDSYAVGRVRASPEVATGGISAGPSLPKVENSFFDNQLTRQRTSYGGEGLHTREMVLEETYKEAGWNFSNVWAINHRFSVFPTFKNQNPIGKHIDALFVLNHFAPEGISI